MHFPSALLALALALPGRLHARPYVYEPRENDPRIVLEEQPASETHCLGFDSRSRTCRFRDLFYDAASGRFRVYTHASVAAALQPLLDLADSSEPFLQVGIYPWYMMPKDERFFLDVESHSQMPETPAACDVQQATYLLRPYRLMFFGHMLRDNFHHIAANLLALNREGTPHDLLIWRSKSNIDSRSLVVPEKYVGMVASSLLDWEDLLEQCRTASGEASALLRFRDVVVGSGGLDLRGDDLQEADCSRNDFLTQQQIAYSNHDMEQRPVQALPTFKVLFGDKDLSDKRRIVNIPEVVAYLTARFPALEIKSVVLSALHASEQLVELSTTTVFVTPIGSSSFRLIYLPQGAHTILVGAPEGAVPLDGGAEATVQPFREAEACWDNLGYVTIDKYHVSGAAEYELRYKRTPWLEKNIGMYNRFQVWDADVVLVPERVGDMVASALAVVSTSSAAGTSDADPAPQL